MFKILLLSIICCFSVSISSFADDKKSKKENSHTHLSADEQEQAKYMRDEFVMNMNIIKPRKRPYYYKTNPLEDAGTLKKLRQENINDVKKVIKKYEAFADINAWERAQIQFTQSRLAIAEGRYKEATNLLSTIIKEGHISDKTMSKHYYTLYKLAFKLQNYQHAKEYLTNAYSLDHRLYAWDFASLAEIEFRVGKHKEGINFLTNAIDALEKSKCPVEDKWINILQKATDEPSGETIKNLQAFSVPWFYSISLDELSPYPRKTRMEPRYPRSAAKKGMSGHIALKFIIDDEGSVVCSFLVEGAGKIFLKPSQDAVSKFKYHPSIENGKASWTYGIGTKFTFALSRR